MLGLTPTEFFARLVLTIGVGSEFLAALFVIPVTSG